MLVTSSIQFGTSYKSVHEDIEVKSNVTWLQILGCVSMFLSGMEYNMIKSKIEMFGRPFAFKIFFFTSCQADSLQT